MLHPVDFTAPPADLANDPTADPAEHSATLTWTQVCERTRRTPHALMQWRSITTPAPGIGLPLSSEGLWHEVDVEEGTLEPAALAALLDVLEPFTTKQECYHALWEGYGWFDGDSSSMLSAYADSEGGPPPPPPRRAQVPLQLQQALAAPRLSLPGRDHLLFTGPLRAALAIGRQVTDAWFRAQSPNLLWPAHHSWCVASEIDFDSTLIGGSPGLIEAVLAAPGLDVLPRDVGRVSAMRVSERRP